MSSFLASSSLFDTDNFNKEKNTSTGALLIGCNYTHTPAWRLGGCHNDVDNMLECILNLFKFDRDTITVVKDNDLKPLPNQPGGKQHLLDGINDLVNLSNLNKGGRYVFHFSGHGTQVADRDGDEVDGKDEAFLTSDGDLIKDDEIKQYLVDKLHPDSKCLIIIDACHSGTGGDLPFTWKYEQHECVVASNLKQEDIDKICNKQLSDVVMISGCQDTQTSADATIENQRSGAMTWGFIKAIEEINYYRWASPPQFCYVIRDKLKNKYTQLPCVSSTRPLALQTQWLKEFMQHLV
jgi:metacaspase-1